MYSFNNNSDSGVKEIVGTEKRYEVDVVGGHRTGTLGFYQIVILWISATLAKSTFMRGTLSINEPSSARSVK